MGQPKVINPATYLGGGRDFGPVVPGSADIISRNLTPDKTGLPEGGRTFAEFVQIMRTGVDLDSLHPLTQAAFRLRSAEIFSRRCTGLVSET